MKPFDLEAAKRGEPICGGIAGARFQFIGVGEDEWVVVKNNRGEIVSLPQDSLCMDTKENNHDTRI